MKLKMSCLGSDGNQKSVVVYLQTDLNNNCYDHIPWILEIYFNFNDALESIWLQIQYFCT